MTVYRADGKLIVRQDAGPGSPAAVVVDGDPGLADRIAWLLTFTCPTCTGPTRQTVGMVCPACGTDYAPIDPAEFAEAVRLLRYALHLREHGELAPGGKETWGLFDRACESFLRRL
jgi:hypothetical protein